MLGSDEGCREVVLGLPLTRLLVKLVRVPAEADVVETALPVLKAASPFPDDELTVGYEIVREGEDGKIVLAAALPESAADDIGVLFGRHLSFQIPWYCHLTKTKSQ